MARGGLVSTGLDDALRAASWASFALSAFLYAPIGGLLVPVVADLLAARTPAPPARLRAIGSALGRSFPSSLVMLSVMVVVGALVILPAEFLVALGGQKRDVTLLIVPLYGVLASAALAPFAVVPACVVVEGGSGLAPLRRSAALVRPMLRPAFGVVLFYTLLTQALPELALLVLRALAAKWAPGTAAALETLRVRWLLLWIANAALLPFVLVPPAMLYLRAREAEGETIFTQQSPLAGR
jgi:hypothetical protein